MSISPFAIRKIFAELSLSNRWPYQNQEEYKLFTSDYFNFLIEGHGAPLGYVHKVWVDTLRWPSFWDINHEKRLLVLSGQSSFDERTKAMEDTLRQGHKDGKVECLREWGNVLIPIISSGEVLLNMDLCGVDIFGIVASGVHLTAYTRTEEGLKYWVPRRAKTKQPFPGMLDNTVATNLAFGQEPLEKLIQKALEEASIPENYTRTHAIKCGTVSYHMSQTNDSRPGCQRHIQHVYEMELAREIVPTPANSDVKEFRLMSVKEVTEALVHGEFNFRAMTWIAYFVRHGIVNANNEANLEEVRARLHRKHDPVVV